MAADAHEKGLEHKLWQTNESYLITVKGLVSIWVNYNALVQKGSRPNLENKHPNISHVGNGIIKITHNHPKSPITNQSHPEISQVRNLGGCMQ